MTQMEQWSILSNVLNYVQHNRFHTMNHTLDIKAVNKYKYKSNTGDRVQRVGFWYDATEVTRGIHGHIWRDSLRNSELQ